jgi:uncharacterized Zn finger protein
LKLKFSVRGSKGDLYTVTATKKDGSDDMQFKCSCLGGDNGRFCKHRMALLLGDITNLASNNIGDVETLREMISGTEIESCVSKVYHLQAQLDQITAQLRRAKDELAIATRG